MKPRRSNKIPADFAKRVSAGLKTMHAKRRREKAREKLIKCAIAWAAQWASWPEDELRFDTMQLVRAVRAFESENA